MHAARARVYNCLNFDLERARTRSVILLKMKRATEGRRCATQLRLYRTTVSSVCRKISLASTYKGGKYVRIVYSHL